MANMSIYDAVPGLGTHWIRGLDRFARVFLRRRSGMKQPKVMEQLPC